MRKLLLMIPVVCSSVVVGQATGHFPQERGKFGDWFWKDVQGYYSAQTNGARTPQEHFTVFCNNPDSRGGVAFSIGVDGSQIGKKRLSLAFDNGTTIDVIASHAHVSASSVQGERIIRSVLNQLRTGRQLSVRMAGAPTARFSLRGSTAALKRCP